MGQDKTETAGALLGANPLDFAVRPVICDP